jgi:hypothetical protein
VDKHVASAVGLLTARSHVYDHSARRNAARRTELTPTLATIMNNLLTIKQLGNDDRSPRKQAVHHPKPELARQFMVADVFFLYCDDDELTAAGVLMKKLVTQGNVLKAGEDNVRKDFNSFSVSARSNNSENKVDRYALTGKNSQGNFLYIMAEHLRSHDAIEISSNNLSDIEVEEWMLDLERALEQE